MSKVLVLHISLHCIGCILCYGEVWRGFIYLHCSFTSGDIETSMRFERPSTGFNPQLWFFHWPFHGGIILVTVTFMFVSCPFLVFLHMLIIYLRESSCVCACERARARLRACVCVCVITVGIWHLLRLVCGFSCLFWLFVHLHKVAYFKRVSI